MGALEVIFNANGRRGFIRLLVGEVLASIPIGCQYMQSINHQSACLTTVDNFIRSWQIEVCTTGLWNMTCDVLFFTCCNILWFIGIASMFWNQLYFIWNILWNIIILYHNRLASSMMVIRCVPFILYSMYHHSNVSITAKQAMSDLYGIMIVLVTAKKCWTTVSRQKFPAIPRFLMRIHFNSGSTKSTVAFIRSNLLFT